MRSLGWTSRLLLAGFALLAAIATQAQKKEFSITDRFTFCPTNGGIFLPVKIGGKEYLFLLDTGTSWIVYDRSFAKLLGPPVKSDLVKATGPEAKTNQMFKAPAALLGTISLQTPEPVLMQDFADFRLISHLPVYGVIGMSVLGRHLIHLDFDENEVKFLVPLEPPRKPPIETSPPVPKVPVFIPMFPPVNCLLDSGSENFGGFAPDLFDELVRSGKLRVFGTNITTSFDRLQLMAKGRLEHIQILNHEFRNVVFDRGGPNRIGYAFITNYNWLLDMSHLQSTPMPRAHLQTKPAPPAK